MLTCSDPSKFRTNEVDVVGLVGIVGGKVGLPWRRSGQSRPGRRKLKGGFGEVRKRKAAGRLGGSALPFPVAVPPSRRCTRFGLVAEVKHVPLKLEASLKSRFSDLCAVP